MSHVVTLKVKPRCKKVLRETFESLGGTWNEGATRFKWWGRSVGDYPLPQGFSEKDLVEGICSHTVSFPNVRYEVGIIEVDSLPENHAARTVTDADGHLLYPPGTMIPIFDFVDWHLKQLLGGVETARGEMVAKKFNTAYAVAVAKEAARKKGYKTFTEVRENGKIKIKGRK